MADSKNAVSAKPNINKTTYKSRESRGVGTNRVGTNRVGTNRGVGTGTNRGDTNALKNNLFKKYLDNITKDDVDEEMELEVKFGTIGNKISRINYNNIIKKLLSLGFTIDTNVYLLRIQNEYTDPKTRTIRQSDIRTEINGLQNIRKYCQTNRIDTIETGVSYTHKSRFGNKENPSSVDVDDFNFRISLSKEKRLKKNDPRIRTMLDSWADQKKRFRYLNRFKLRHPSFPVLIDMSIVKQHYNSEYNIHDSGVFKAFEKYEVEIESINSLVGIGTPYNEPDILNNNVLKPIIKYVLSGIQETNYPIGFIEQNDVLQEYMKLLWGKEYNEEEQITSSNFVGPSSTTLQLENIRPINSDVSSPNIRENYSVTDKADGDRKLLFISSNGKIYFINTNMDIQFTGTLSKNKEIWNTLLDGEHILYDKKKKFINLYTAFDIYYVAGEDVRSNAFIPPNVDDVQINYRLPIMESIIKKINAVSVISESSPIPLRITNKRFYNTTDTQTIFQGCTFILTKEHDGLFEYETDGLIFTPMNRGVASDKIGEFVKPKKITWEHSFKWKPVKYNTIDFLVSVKKNDNGDEFIGNMFQSGTDMSTSTQIPQYKTLVLRVGFDEYKHGFINPYQDAIEDKVPDYLNYEETKRDRQKSYMPKQFYPTNPSDKNAGICNLLLSGNVENEKNMLSEENDIIQDNMIVEFRYDITREPEWRWIPLRVRYDKTAQLMGGEKMFGNAYHVANSNWHSIHKPITQMMIMSGSNIPEELGDDDVYYNKVRGATKTGSLRDFHNLYVKTSLIKSISKPGDTLIDLAVGKGGDWPKWIDTKLKFVFGVDISRDNIQNRLNGAYARYLTFRKKYRVMPSALFVNGNSSVNIRNTNGILVDKDKQITRAVFGQGPKDAKLLGQGVYKQYGVASEGFDICSIQFAIHYMFENQETLHNFLRNVSEVTKEGGYFIGTSYDGQKIFNMLKNIPENESKVIMDTDHSTGDKKIIWELTKRYSNEELNDDESCLGYSIDVYQESINKTIREYLVNYTYLTRILENYGFVLVGDEELKKLNSKITSGTGLFNDLFKQMNDEIKNKTNSRAFSYDKAQFMSDGERTISFLNRYFIYKKVRKISNTEKVSLDLQDKTEVDVDVVSNDVTLPSEEHLRPKNLVKRKLKVSTKKNTKEHDGEEKTKTKTKAAAAAAPGPIAKKLSVIPEESMSSKKESVVKLKRTLKINKKVKETTT